MGAFVRMRMRTTRAGRPARSPRSGGTSARANALQRHRGTRRDRRGKMPAMTTLPNHPNDASASGTPRPPTHSSLGNSKRAMIPLSPPSGTGRSGWRRDCPLYRSGATGTAWLGQCCWNVPWRTLPPEGASLAELGRRVIPAVVPAAVLVLCAIACGPHSLRQAMCVDPTDSCNWSVVVVQNDSQRPVSLRGCIHHCGKGDQRVDPVVVSAGRRSPATQYGGVSALTGTRSWVAVESVQGKTLGCLVVDGHPDKSDGDLVRVNQNGALRRFQREGCCADRPRES
jgi:hypothetical protein